MTNNPFISAMRVWPVYVPTRGVPPLFFGEVKGHTTNDAERFTISGPDGASSKRIERPSDSGPEQPQKPFHHLGGDDKRRAAMPLDGITMQEGSFITHEVDEWFPGLLLRVEEGGDYGYGDTIRFVIQIDDEDGETWALASQKLTPRTKLYGWVKAIDATLIPEVGQPFKYKELENRRVEVMFEQGDDRERVTKIRAAKKAQTPLQKKQAQASAAKKMVVEDPDEAPY